MNAYVRLFNIIINLKAYYFYFTLLLIAGLLCFVLTFLKQIFRVFIIYILVKIGRTSLS